METKKQTQEKLVEPKVINTKTTDTKEVDIFTLVKHEENVLILIGNNIMSQRKFRTFTEATNYIKSKPYELIINVACFAMHIQTQKQNEKS